MLNKKLASNLIIAFLLACAFSGCGKKSEVNNPVLPAKEADSDVYPLPPKAVPGIPGGRVVLATIADPKTFNIITANETSSTDIAQRMNTGLVGLDVPAQEIVPGLAESWSVEPDNVTWTFHLRKGLHWSDGQPLTAQDVTFTWNDVIYNTNFPNPTRDQFTIDGKNFLVTNLDDDTVRVVTPGVYAPFLVFFGSAPVLPKHVLASSVADKSFESAYGINTAPSNLVVCGPFRLKEYKQGQYVMLERNPEFWEVDSKGQRLPYLDNVIYEIVPDMNAMSLRFLKGEVDIQEIVRPAEYENFIEESAKGKFKVIELGLASERDMLFFNQNPENNPKTGKPRVDPVKLKWFQNTKFRQAISYAMDRDAIVKVALGGHGKPNYNFVTARSTIWYNTNIMSYPHNPEKALALLAEIGIKPGADGALKDEAGNPIEFVLLTNSGNDRRQKTGVIFQEDLKRIGIKVIFQPLDFNNLIDRMDNAQDFDCVLLGWAGGSPDPVYPMNILKSSGFSHQWYRAQKTPATPWEARMDELMNAQLKTLDQNERKKYYDEVQVILAEQMAMIPTATMKASAAVNVNLGNIRGTTLDANRITWNLEEIYIKK